MCVILPSDLMNIFLTGARGDPTLHAERDFDEQLRSHFRHHDEVAATLLPSGTPPHQLGRHRHERPGRLGSETDPTAGAPRYLKYTRIMVSKGTRHKFSTQNLRVFWRF